MANLNIFRGEVEAKIGGKTRLFKFGTNQMAILTEKLGKDLGELSVGVQGIRDFIWSALVAGARKRKEQVDFDEWDVGDWIDDMEQSEFDKVNNTIDQSLPKDLEEDTSKKK